MEEMAREKTGEYMNDLLKREQINKGLIYTGKKTLYSIILLISGVISLNSIGLGNPYIKDKSKKYCVQTYTYTSDNNNTKKYRYKYLKDIDDDFSKSSILTVKDKYKLTGNSEYTRKVTLYEVEGLRKNDYKEALKNYQKYLSDKKIDEYYETVLQIDENIKNKMEINFKFNQIDKTDYITIEESDARNTASSIIYTIFAILVSYGYFVSLYEEYSYRKEEIDEINKKSKRRNLKK